MVADMTDRISLQELFCDLQAEMDKRLHTKRKNVHHSGAKGSGTELNWTDMLNDYLPKRYQADRAFVVDSTGAISEQIDIVIYDRQYSPFLFNQDDILYVPAESVYSVIEVKQDLDKGFIKYAGKKAESVRSLLRTSVQIKHAGGKFKAVRPFHIPAGIVTTDNAWQSLGRPFESAILGLTSMQRLDFGCALTGGAFEVEYPAKGKTVITKSKPEDSLIFFFLRLVSRLQRMGTVPALDVMEYAKVIGH
jgi:hypothetical protein